MAVSTARATPAAASPRFVRASCCSSLPGVVVLVRSPVPMATLVGTATGVVGAGAPTVGSAGVPAAAGVALAAGDAVAAGAVVVRVAMLNAVDDVGTGSDEDDPVVAPAAGGTGAGVAWMTASPAVGVAGAERAAAGFPVASPPGGPGSGGAAVAVGGSVTVAAGDGIATLVGVAINPPSRRGVGVGVASVVVSRRTTTAVGAAEGAGIGTSAPAARAGVNATPVGSSAWAPRRDASPPSATVWSTDPDIAMPPAVAGRAAPTAAPAGPGVAVALGRAALDPGGV